MRRNSNLGSHKGKRRSSKRRKVSGKEEKEDGVSSNQWAPKLFSMESTPPGLELKNSYAALDERDSDDEIPLLSVEDFPTISTEPVLEKNIVPRGGKFKKETQKHQKIVRRQRATSLREVKQEVRKNARTSQDCTP